MIKALYDGWSLCRAPNSPEALHLLSLLSQRHPEVQPVVALPGKPPAWLPEGTTAHVEPDAETPSARLGWEQRALPRIAKTFRADLLHVTASHPPLLGSTPVVLSPADYPSSTPAEGMIDRLRAALASGGLSRLRGLLWPSDLETVPPEGLSAPLYLLPPGPMSYDSQVADAHLVELAAPDLPETYIIYHGPVDTRSLRHLLEAWSWAAHSIGEYYPLLILGLDVPSRQQLQALLAGSGLENTVRALPALEPALIPRLYQGCAAVFHPSPLSAWGQTAWLALRLGKPLVAAESALADALVGNGAYLLSAGEKRELGAALITVIVEEGVAESLTRAGRQRSTEWDQRSFSDSLFDAYQAVLAVR